MKKLRHSEVKELVLLQKYHQMRNQVTLREVENLGCILCLWSQMSSHSKFWAPNKEFTGYLKGSAGHQVIRNVLGLIGEPVLG
jgi:hypothetical protein